MSDVIDSLHIFKGEKQIDTHCRSWLLSRAAL